MDYEGFKREILKMSDIDLSLYKEKQMKRRIDSLIRKNGYDRYEDYVQALKLDKELYNEFINYLTINVSEFYRNPDQWEVLREQIIPMLLQGSPTLKIWSSACSTGDEPYTLAMVLTEHMPLSRIHILATDIDVEALRKAKEGVYSVKSLEKLPEKYIRDFFIKDGNTYCVREELKRCVEFRRLNLLRDPYPDGCDLIVCRNVLIYFTEEAKSQIYVKFNRALKDRGVLFIGSTELIIMSAKYKLTPIKTFFYIKDGDI
ncbi:MAG TPA: protein-glutamate O-methyltransferase CheR [Clostridiales bacterium]|nr:protein-glutamate O-methyltransferase CheR [Clostridiales bacterium]